MSRWREVTIGDCRPTQIYALCGPGGDEPRYVGKTCGPLVRRHKAHISASEKPRLPVHRWIASLYRKGGWSCIKLLEIVPAGADWAARERYWIKRLRDEGAALLNLTDGGEGQPGIVWTPERKAKLSASRRRGENRRCDACGESFWRRPSDLAKGNARFCSRVCYQNWQRGKSKNSAAPIQATAAAAALKRARPSCRHGHPFTEQNTRINKRGARICRACERASGQRYSERHHVAAS